MQRKVEINNISFFLLSIIFFVILNLFAWSNILISLSIASWVIFSFAILFSFAINFPKIQKALFSFFWLQAVILIFFKKTFNISFGMEVALSMLQTINEPEIGIELLSLSFFIWLFAVGLIPIFFIYYGVKIKKLSTKKTLLFQGFFTVFAVFFIIIKLSVLNGYFVKEPESISTGVSRTVIFSPIDFIYFTARANKVLNKQKKVMESENFKFLSKEYEYSFDDTELKDLKIIFLMGETAVGKRFAINGYHRNTTPNLSKLNKNYFFNFQNTTACNTYTIASTKCVVSRMTFNTYKNLETESSFSDIFKSLGFSIKIISQQSMFEFYKYLEFDEMISRYEIMNQSKNLSVVTDEQLLPIIESEVQSSDKELIFIHMQGSHIKYSLRYTKDFEIYKPACEKVINECSKEELNNAYDNTIVYTDFVLNEIIKRLENQKAIVIYTSDHGESLGENGSFGHAAPQLNAPKEQLDVPFFIYISPKFAATKQGRKVQKTLSEAVKKPLFSHDNIFHTLLSCVGIKNKNEKKPLIDKTLDLCNF